MHEKIGAGKTLLLLMPEEFGINDVLAENLRFHGFDVIYIKKPAFKYNNLWERLCNSVRKKILKDDTYKIKQQEKLQIQLIMSEIQQRKQKIDYALFIRADIFSIENINLIKQYTQKIINYQWDGMDRFPEIFERISLFDKFFVFDENDVKKYPQYDLELTTNFYFEQDKNVDLIQNNRKTIYYVGSHVDNRANAIVKLLENLDIQQFNFNVLISNIDKNLKKQQMYTGLSVEFIKKVISFAENLQQVKQADIILDFKHAVHNGLSFRCFEALYYKKKLITNNEEIKKYDFYHPDNIFVWDGEHLDLQALKQFLEQPYYSLPKEIIEYYALGSWIQRIFNIRV